MNVAFLNPRIWLRNSIKAVPKLKQCWRDWLNAPLLAEVVEKQGREIERINYWLERLREKASSQYLSSNTAPPGHPTVSPLSRTHTHSHE